MTPTVASVDQFVRQREVEISIASAGRYRLTLHGEYEGYGDFFTIELDDVEYIDVASCFVAGGVRQLDIRDAELLRPKWRGLSREWGGVVLVFWGAGYDGPEAAPDTSAFLVIAGRIRVEPGADWQE